MPKATRKSPATRVDVPKLRLVSGINIPKVPKSIQAAALLSAAPVVLAELPGYLSHMTDQQLKTGWRAVLATALCEELDARGLITKPEARGVLANFLRSMTEVHERLIA